MVRHLRWFLPLLLGLGVCACVGSHPSMASGPSCVALFDSCTPGGLACCEGFCASTGTGASQCLSRAPDGSFCRTDDECASGRCVAGVCGPSACIAEGGHCTEGGCCSGLICTTAFPAPGLPVQQCFRLRADGESCEFPAQCASGLCSAGRCGPPPACLGEGVNCYHRETECCAGLGCFGLGAYGSNECLRPLADGQPCDPFVDACASLMCTDGLCRSTSCGAEGGDCWTSEACCAGFCSYDPTRYGFGHCTAFLTAGAACLADFWCTSRSCVNGTCAP